MDVTVGGRWGQTTAWGLRLRKEKLGEEPAEPACPEPQVSSWVVELELELGWLSSWRCAHCREPSYSWKVPL